MTERIIDGFVVRATTSPEEPDAPFYEPAFRFRPVHEAKETEHEHAMPWEVKSQDVEERTQEGALKMAEDWLKRIDVVTWTGSDWNLRFE